MALREWAVVGPDNVVVDRFQMPLEAVQAIKDGSVPPNPVWPTPVSFHDITDLTEADRPRPRWTRIDTGWQAPAQKEIVVGPPPDPARAADDAFIQAMLKKIRAGAPITQDERDKLTVLQLARTAG